MNQGSLFINGTAGGGCCDCDPCVAALFGHSAATVSMSGVSIACVFNLIKIIGSFNGAYSVPITGPGLIQLMASGIISEELYTIPVCSILASTTPVDLAIQGTCGAGGLMHIQITAAGTGVALFDGTGPIGSIISNTLTNASTGGTGGTVIITL